VARIKALDASLLARQGYEFSTLWWNLRRLYFYINNNGAQELLPWYLRLRAEASSSLSWYDWVR
jgi:hypothetical protein